MTLADVIGLSVAFLAPIPPERFDPPRPRPDAAWMACLIMGSMVVLMVMPMITIWGFYRPEESFRSRCEAKGGRPVFTALDGSGPRRCEIGERPHGSGR